jgi:hypothetical protein
MSFCHSVAPALNKSSKAAISDVTKSISPGAKIGLFFNQVKRFLFTQFSGFGILLTGKPKDTARNLLY